MPIDRHHFPPMLGPASKQEVGSFAWGECYGNELDYTAERVRDAVDDLARRFAVPLENFASSQRFLAVAWRFLDKRV